MQVLPNSGQSDVFEALQDFAAAASGIGAAVQHGQGVAAARIEAGKGFAQLQALVLEYAEAAPFESQGSMK